MCIVKLANTVVVRYGIINPMLGADIPTTLSVHPATDTVLFHQGVNRALACVSKFL